MPSSDIVRRVREVVLPVLSETSMELVDVRFLREQGRRVLRLYIDKPGGVDLNDCTMVSRELSALLDVHNIITGRYTLEVSSPGLDRPLQSRADFQRNRGRLLKVVFQDPDGRTRSMFGELASCEEDEIILETKGERVSIGIGDIVSAKIQPRF
jgi:ribosome maturation factor RimP